MSKLKKLLPKRDLRARWLWVLALALTAVKLGLCSFQLIVASPDLSPIDDTLMFNLAKSISAGNWLGEYDWLTLGKHSFYALWLAFLNLLHVNIVVGGQALFAVSCLVLLAALKPVMRTNWGRLFVFPIASCHERYGPFRCRCVVFQPYCSTVCAWMQKKRAKSRSVWRQAQKTL